MYQIIFHFTSIKSVFIVFVNKTMGTPSRLAYQ